MAKTGSRADSGEPYSTLPLLLTRRDVESLLPMHQAIPLARKAFLALNRGQANMPPRIATMIPERHGTHLSMPCYVKTPEVEILMIKVVTVFERNAELGIPTTAGNLLLHDPATGRLLAMMDAEALTTIRTAAASALAADLLAMPGPHSLGLIGAGGQAAAQVEGMMAVRPIDRVLLFSRTQSRAESLATSIRERWNVEALVVHDAGTIARECRLICCATNSLEPVLRGEWLQPGTHISAIGAFRQDMAELEPEAVGRAQVFVDRLSAAQAGAGDLIQANAAGRLDWSDVTELGTVLENPKTRDPKAITLFKSVGLAVQDAFVADHVDQRAREEGIGAELHIE